MVAMTSDVALTVKDVLREIRFAARVKARQLDRHQAALEALMRGQSAAARAGRSPERTGLIYEFASTLARPVGWVAQKICDSEEAAALEPEFLLPITESLGALAADDSDTRFVSSMYRSGKHCLDKLGIRNVYMSEQRILRAARPVAQRHAAALHRLNADPQDASADSIEQRLLMVADATCALVAAQPIKRVEPPEVPAAGAATQAAVTLALADLNAHCFLAAGLATAVASIPGLPARAGFAAVLESAELVAAARHDRFAAALAQVDPDAALAREFAAVVPFLP
jgi:hypothetical protein